MNDTTLMELTADIVSAHVGNNSVATGDVGALIGSVYQALSKIGAPAAIAEEPQAPAVSIRSSVKRDRITCLECGKSAKMLKRHLQTEHGLSTAEYRAKWKLPQDYPLVAPDYAAKRAELAKKIGLGRKKVAAPAKAPAKPRKARTPKAAAQ